MQFFYRKFIQSLPIEDKQFSNQSAHLFSEVELSALRKIYRQTLISTAFVGGACILLYYIPTYIFEKFFQTKILLNIWGLPIEFGIYEMLWCLVLTIFEIVILTLIHLRLTQRVSVISGLLNSNNKDELIKDILKMGTGAKDKSVVNYGLNPVKNVSRIYLLAINTLYIFKAFLSNQLLRFILRRFIARYLFKYFLDLIGTPIYMFFNALNSHFVYKNIVSSLMGRQIISIYIKELQSLELDEDEKELVYDALHLVVISKKDYSTNHAVLTKAVIENLKIKTVKDHKFKEENLRNFQSYRLPVQKLVLDIIVLGYVLDGRISGRERRQIAILKRKYGFNFSLEALVQNSSDFMKGRGVELVGIK